ncbi:MAG: GIY-YIG nuclease family protein [Candidatus Paceibacterota bacterium]
MKRTDFKINELPDKPGVYFFRGSKKEILYIGKATSLKNRVSSYFSSDIEIKRSELIKKMVTESFDVDYTETESVLEALILETNLIRSHKPKYNTRSKDDKSYNHLIITKEDYPRVLLVRGKDLTEKFSKKDLKYEFGPFTSASLLREALKVVRRLFKYYDTRLPIGKEKSKMIKGQIDFNRQIGLYPEVDNKDEYNKTIKHIALLFQGKKQIIIKELEKEMMLAAKKEAFEKASIYKKRIFGLKHINDISLINNDYKRFQDGKSFRIEGYDVAHYRGKDMVGVMVVIEDCQTKNSDYRKFKIKTLSDANDPAALKEVLMRRLEHKEWILPNLIVVDGNTIQKTAAESVLKENNLSIPVVSVVKNDKHKPIKIVSSNKIVGKYKDEILLANAEAHRFAINYFRNLNQKSFKK